MGIESEIARDIALQFECKLDALRRNQDGTVKLTLTINPADFPKQLMTDPMGQRYVAVMVALNEDETPKVTGQTDETASLGQAAPEAAPRSPAPSKNWNELSYAQRSGMLANDVAFHQFLMVSDQSLWDMVSGLQDNDRATAAEIIRIKCGVSTRANIGATPDSANTYTLLENSFDHWKKYERSAA